MATVSAFLEVYNCIGVFHLEENLPPHWNIDEETVKRAWGFGNIEVVRECVRMSEATKSESVFDLLFSVTDIRELFLTTDAAKLRACWVLGVIMESKFIIRSNKLLYVERFSNLWLLNLMRSWASCKVEFRSRHLD